jgi:hypothetical protein
VLQRVPQQHEDAVGIEWLLENVVRAQLRGLDGSLNRGVSADHHDLCRWVDLLDAAQSLEAVHARHLHVHEHEVRPPLLVFGDAIRGVAGGADLVALELQELAERGPDALLVIDDEDASAHLAVVL